MDEDDVLGLPSDVAVDADPEVRLRFFVKPAVAELSEW